MTPLLAQRQRPDRVFERLYRRHVGDVYRYAFAVLRNQSDAEDVTQTTFMNAYRAFQRGERPEKPRNWLIAIAHNVCRQRFRQSARRPVEVAFDDELGVALTDADDSPTGEDIRRALGHLAFNQRAAVVMRELEGRSYAEIAEILGVSTSAVETLIFRARRALREQLESSLTCVEAELAISKQLDGRLPRAAKGALRAHLRECSDCATFARRQRAQRTALKSLAAVPLPSSLASLFGGGGATVGGGLAVKAAVAVSAGVAIGGAGYAGIHEAVTHHHHATHARASVQPAPAQAESPRDPVIVPAAIGGPAEATRSPLADRKQPHGPASAHKKHVRPHRKHVTAAWGHVHAKHFRVAHVPPARGHVTHVSHSHRTAVAPGRTNQHHTVQPKPVHHGKPASGGGNANGHGK